MGGAFFSLLKIASSLFNNALFKHATTYSTIILAQILSCTAASPATSERCELEDDGDVASLRDGDTVFVELEDGEA